MPHLNVITCPVLLREYQSARLSLQPSIATSRAYSLTRSITSVTAVESVSNNLNALLISPTETRMSYTSLDHHRGSTNTSILSYTTDNSVSPPHTGFFEHIFKRNTWSSNDTSNPAVERILETPSPTSPLSFHEKPQSRGFKAPVDGTVASLTSLPQAFFGWSRKQSLTQFFSLKPTWKPKFLVQSNATLYIFSTDQVDATFSDSLILGKRAGCVVEGDSLRVTGEVLIGDDVLMVKTLAKRSIVLKFNDEVDLGIWHDIILTAIDEAKLGRRPLSYKKDTQTASPKSGKSVHPVDEEKTKGKVDIYGFLDDINEREKEIQKNSDNIFVTRKTRS